MYYSDGAVETRRGAKAWNPSLSLEMVEWRLGAGKAEEDMQAAEGHAHAHTPSLFLRGHLLPPQLQSPPLPFPFPNSPLPRRPFSPPLPFSPMPSDSPNHARDSCTSPFSPAFISLHFVDFLLASPQGSRSTSPTGRDVLTLRALVSTRDAGVIIGKGGKNVADLREQTGVKAGVSRVVTGIHERVLSITGSVESVAKVCSCVAMRVYISP
jgi:predicted RNA-binding protein YlqC (UPF0109 family)